MMPLMTSISLMALSPLPMAMTGLMLTMEADMPPMTSRPMMDAAVKIFSVRPSSSKRFSAFMPEL